MILRLCKHVARKILSYIRWRKSTSTAILTLKYHLWIFLITLGINYCHQCDLSLVIMALNSHILDAARCTCFPTVGMRIQLHAVVLIA